MIKKNLTQEIQIENITISLTQKRIKNLHLRICPPYGEVRVSAPWRLSSKAIHNFISSKISWIKEKQIEVRNRKIIPPLKFLDGEEHYFFGQKFTLKIIENVGTTGCRPQPAKVSLYGDILELHLKKISTQAQRKKIIHEFYRTELKKIIPHFITEFEKKMNVKVAEFGVKKMKTRWGTCNTKARRIWLNLELAKKPLQCLEYIVVHEMTHLLERGHTKRFFALMDQFLPEWRKWKVELNPARVKL